MKKSNKLLSKAIEVEKRNFTHKVSFREDVSIKIRKEEKISYH